MRELWGLGLRGVAAASGRGGGRVLQVEVTRRTAQRRTHGRRWGRRDLVTLCECGGGPQTHTSSDTRNRRPHWGLKPETPKSLELSAETSWLLQPGCTF
eukprot:3019411-Prymnesium_polylepis.1